MLFWPLFPRECQTLRKSPKAHKNQAADCTFWIFLDIQRCASHPPLPFLKGTISRHKLARTGTKGHSLDTNHGWLPYAPPFRAWHCLLTFLETPLSDPCCEPKVPDCLLMSGLQLARNWNIETTRSELPLWKLSKLPRHGNWCGRCFFADVDRCHNHLGDRSLLSLTVARSWFSSDWVMCRTQPGLVPNHGIS